MLCSLTALHVLNIFPKFLFILQTASHSLLPKTTIYFQCVQCFYKASLTVVAEIPPQGVVWTCCLHRKRLTDPLLTWTVGQREEGRRDAKRKGGVDKGQHGGEGCKGQTGGE